MTKFDKIANRVYQRLYRKFRGKNFPRSLFDKELVRERMKERLKKLGEDPLKIERKRKQIFKFVNVTPNREMPILQDFFQNPSKIPKSKKEDLDEFMKVPRSYDDIKRKLKELEEND